MDDAKEEEEEEEIEAEEDRDWLEEDEENKDKQTWAAAPPIKFASFLNWKFSLDGEPRPNENDGKQKFAITQCLLHACMHEDIQYMHACMHEKTTYTHVQWDQVDASMRACI